MSRPIVTTTATPSLMKQPSDNGSKKSRTTSKFFEQSKYFHPRMNTNTNKKHKRGNAIPKAHVERMICSEDVSRRKKVKLDITSIFSSNITTSRENIENDSDILESLITNFHKDSSKQSESQFENAQRRKLSSKPRALFNEESMKLMRDFKEFLRGKEQAEKDSANTELPRPSHSSVPLNDNSNSQFDGETIHHSSNRIWRKGCENSSRFNSPQRNLIALNMMNGAVPNHYPPQLIKIAETTSESNDITHEMRDVRILSQMRMPDPLSFVTTVVDSADDSDHPITRYPTPPLNYSPNFIDN